MKRKILIIITAALTLCTSCSSDTNEKKSDQDDPVISISETQTETGSEVLSEFSEANLRELAVINSKIPEYYTIEPYDTSTLSGIPLDYRTSGNDIWIITYEETDGEENYIHVYYSDDLFKTPEEKSRLPIDTETYVDADTFLSSDGVLSFEIYNDNGDLLCTGYTDTEKEVHIIDSLSSGQCSCEASFKRIAAYGDQLFLLFYDSQSDQICIRKYDLSGNASEEKQDHLKIISDDIYFIENNDQIDLLIKKDDDTYCILPADDIGTQETAAEAGKIHGQISVDPTGEYQFISENDNHIYGGKIAEQKVELTELYDFTYIQVPSHIRITPVTDDLIIYYDPYYEDTQKIKTIRKITDKEKLDLFRNKSIISYVIDKEDTVHNFEVFSELANEFNQKSDDYYLIQKQMSRKDISEQIEGSHDYDILIYSPSLYCSEELAGKGVFADLRPLIDSIPDIQYEDINPYIAKLCSNEEIMYRFIPKYASYPVYTNPALYPENSMSTEEIRKIAEEIGCKRAINASQLELYRWLSVIINEMTNVSGKEADFENEDFIELISTIKSEYRKYIPKFYYYYLDDLIYDYFRNSLLKKDDENSTVLSASPALFFPEWFPDYLHSTGEKPVIIPIPSTNIIQAIHPVCAVSVMSDCKDLKGAQEFLKLCFSEEIQNRSFYSFYSEFPVTKDGIDKYILKQTETMRNCNKEVTEDEIKIYEDMLRDFIYSPASVVNEASTLSQKIYDLLDKYYDDNMTPEELTEELKIIQQH